MGAAAEKPQSGGSVMGDPFKVLGSVTLDGATAVQSSNPGLSTPFKCLWIDLTAPGPCCSTWDLVPRTGIEPGSPALGS